ncbi:MAG: hypothetical protein IJV00_08905 [Clostridia bacterium]|nr:hypothetical protein [Clostridia bacterium]
MREKNRTVTEDFELFEKGREYNRRIGLYETVSRNERFYRGDQWHGVEAGSLPTPVFNIYRRIINYFISTVMSQKISLSFTAEGMEYLFCQDEKKKLDDACDLITGYLNYRMEKDALRDVFYQGLLDAAVSGDMALYVRWDPEKKNVQGFSGDFVTQPVDSTNVFFGDVNSTDVQSQPYILLSGRELVTRLREEAAANGAGRDQQEMIVSDSDTETSAGDFGQTELEGTKCTYVIKLWKKNGTVRCRKSAAGCVICPERDTGLKRYPLVFMNWEKVKNSYHGQPAGSGLCDNQLYVNKAFAMVMKHMMDLSFSKVVYNSLVIDEWTNEVGEAIAVNGPVDNAAVRLEPGSMQAGFLDVIRLTVSMTKELMGATDAALGNVRPENTSAIIALQQSSQIPLENQRRSLFRAAEDLGMIWLDFILNYYDSSRLIVYRGADGADFGTLDLDGMRGTLFSCSAKAGASAYWSELATVSTLDKLLSEGRISFPQYLERIPEGFIPQKSRLIEEVREREEIRSEKPEEINGKTN